MSEKNNQISYFSVKFHRSVDIRLGLCYNQSMVKT